MPQPAFAAHKLAESNCYDCHAVGGAKDMVVASTRLIKKDARIAELQTGNWSGGDTLPCIYCHDSDTTRTNMVGVKNNFSPAAISKHPVDYLNSSQDSAESSSFSKCRDCHDTNIEYVGLGSNPGPSLNPNIHGVDAGLSGWTSGSQREGVDTWTNTPYNAGGNAMCTTMCHAPGTGSPMNAVDWHGYTGPTVTLEAQSGFVTAGNIGGCLDDGTGTTGCHSPHNADDNTALITVLQDDGSAITADECGACHSFDDGSAFATTGHGQFGGSSDCTQCHDSSQKHFDADGSINSTDPERLIAEDNTYSTYSSPPMYKEANCNNCHGTSNFGTHGIVGCLDCHDPHGVDVGSNIFMIRQTMPVSSPAGTLMAFASTANASYFDTSTSSGNYGFTMCDNPDCHASGRGTGQEPGPVSDLMDSASGSHSGGTSSAVTNDCASCHKHNDAGGSWRATEACTDCHGNPGTGAMWPNGLAPNGSVYENREGAHAEHVAAIDNALGTGENGTCATCHPNGGHTGDQLSSPADVHNDGTATSNFKNLQDATDSNGSYNPGAGVCSNIDCHAGQDTPAWYSAGGTDCTTCHYNTAQDGALEHSAPVTGEHVLHVTASASYVNDCQSCHGANSNAGTHGGHWDGLPSFDTGVITTWTGGTSTCVNTCHDSGTGDWAVAATLACTDCHQGGTYLGSGSNMPATGLHTASASGVEAHDDSFDGASAGCTDCHNNPPTNLHVDGTKQAPNAATYSFTSTNVTVNLASNANTTDDTCTATCHTDNGDWTRKWTRNANSTATAVGDDRCDACHGDNQGSDPSWNAGVVDHVSDQEDPDGTANEIIGNHTDGSVCGKCHGIGASTGSYAFATNHEDGTISMNGPDATPGPVAGAQYNDGTGGCEAACHDPSWTMPVSPNFTVDYDDYGSGDCDTCHAIDNGRDHSDAAESDTTHQTHSGNAYASGCDSCHAHDGSSIPPSTGIHGDGTVNFGGTRMTTAFNYTTTFSDASCSTAANGCHVADGGEWSSGTLVGGATGRCESCHSSGDFLDAGGEADLSASVGPNAGPHDEHMANNSYVPRDCVTCHGHSGEPSATAPTHSTQGNVNIISVANSLTSIASLPDCTNACHDVIPGSYGDWTDGNPLDCLDCHSGGWIASAYQPSSGLHNMTLVTPHDESIGANRCSECHATPAGTHINGSWTADNSSNTDRFVNRTNLTWNDGSTNNGTCSGSGLSGCHTDSGNWTRKWSTAADSTSQTLGDARCDVCHGDGQGADTSWNAGVVDHVSDQEDPDATPNEIIGNHTEGSVCGKCHGFGATGQPSTYTWGTDHESGAIMLNGPDATPGPAAGTEYNDGTGGCEAACHLPSYTMPTSASFTVEYGDYGSGTCDSCHGNSTNATYWPDGAARPDRAGEHAAHISALQAEAGFTTSDAGQLNMCAYCHNDATGVGGGGHNDASGPADVGAFDRIWDGTADGGIAAVYTPGDGTNGNCAGVDCHAEGTTPSNSQWYDGGSTDCTMCHNDGTDSGTLANADPGTGRHAEHLASNVYVPNDCTDCHGANASAGNHSGHRSGGPSYGNDLTSYTAPDCANACHNVIPGVAGDWLDANPLDCTDCHGTVPATAIGGGANMPTTGLHDETPTTTSEIHDQTLDGGVGCEGCHSTNPSDNHLDGTKQLSAPTINFNGATVGFSDGTPPTCATSCHTDGGAWSRLWHENSDQSNGTECAGCHGDFTSGFNSGVSLRHTGTDADGDILNNHGGASDPCYQCHTYNSAETYYTFSSQHNDTNIQLNNQNTFVDAGALVQCDACHTTPYGTADEQHSFEDVTSRWTRVLQNGPAAGCDTCHGDGAGQYWPDDTPSAAWPDREGAHNEHVAALGNGNSSCAWCHFSGSHTGDQASSPADVGGFETMSGASDADGAYSPTATTCANIDCHASNTTPGWYGAAPDTNGPTFSPNGNVTASTGDALAANVSWNAATDGEGSTPVSYDLYWSTDGTPLTLPLGTMLGLGSTSAVVTFASSTSSVEFQVVAKDSQGNTTNSNVSNSVNISAASGGGSCDMDPSGTYIEAENFTTSSTNFTTGANGSANGGFQITASGGNTTFPPTTTPQQYQVNFNDTGTWYISFLGTATGGADNSVHYGLDSTGVGNQNHPTGTLIWGNAVQTNGPDPTAITVGSTGLHEISIYARENGYVLDGMYLSQTQDITSGAAQSMPGTVIDPSSGCGPTNDTSAPTWGSSGITVTDPASDGELSISWNTATDPETPPVTYWLYRKTGTSTGLFTSPDGSWPIQLGTTSYVDSGLTNGTTYFYGVRAENNDPLGKDRTTNTDFDSAAPTAGGGSGGLDCNDCHASHPGSGSHNDHSDTDTDYSECDSCHGNASYSVSGNYTTAGPAGSPHNDGSLSMYFPGDAGAAWNDPTCASINCHFDATTPTWYGGTTTCATDCHGYPPDGSGGTVNHNAGITVAPATTTNFLDQHGVCETCHGAESASRDGSGAITTHANYPAGSHGDGFIRMNGPDTTPGPAAGAEYNDGNGGCEKACHNNDATYQMDSTSSLFNVNYADFGAGSCDGCHSNGGTGPEVVWPSGGATGRNTSYGSHLGATTAEEADGYLSGVDWNVQCNKCHEFHSGPITVPNYGTVGINYASNGALHLGTAGQTGFEAAFCWDCHDANTPTAVSEWGQNLNANTGSLTYNYGGLYTALTGGSTTSRWNGAYWRSAEAEFSYKNQLVSSTHTANAASGSSVLSGSDYNRTEGPDPDSEIRCSYCHDVHDTFGISGKPYLRGTWKGNPYKEDGAPRSGMSGWSEAWEHADVPRADPSTTNRLGGFWIDQNSGDPNSSETHASTAGLCDLCHSGPAYGTASNWTSGYDGHENVLVGAGDIITGAAIAERQMRNIFNRTWRGSGTNYNNEQVSKTAYVDMGVASANGTGDRGFTYRGNNSGDGLQLQPFVGGSVSRPYSFQYFMWNNTFSRQAISTGTVSLIVADGNITTGTDNEPYDGTNDRPNYNAQPNYHTFNCGKCHNPHASRLPKLLITNCLDTRQNTWDESVSTQMTAGTTPWDNMYASNWASAQNCHRLDERGSDPTPNTSLGRGWNKVSPW
jgi:predicted CxxxxCH...CXXCH cytochrome family protein